MLLVFDVVAIVFCALHDRWMALGGAILAIVIEVMSKFSLFALTMALINVAAGIATAVVLVEVGA
jgi:hypothetical protein